MSQTVTIVQRRLTHYRVPLFEQMRSILERQGVQLRLLYGEPTQAERSKNDSGEIDWGEKLPTHYLAKGRLCWQPFAAPARGSDLLILTQENKLLNNLVALAAPSRGTALAFWGHGRNMQASNPASLRERFKRWTTRRVDWWFAYTQMSADFVRADGFPAERITVVNNSIDTGELRRAVEAARQFPASELRSRLGLQGGPLAVFVGSLYADKRIPFLLDAAQAIQKQVPAFQLAIAGDGPERALVEQVAARASFIKYLGGVRGRQKAELLASADLMLNPGLVGLGIVDAFVAGLPLLTTDCGIHSPEISYLCHDVNGLMTADTMSAYVSTTLALLASREELARLRCAALKSGAELSIERMAERFCLGIMACLSQSPSRPARAARACD